MPKAKSEDQVLKTSVAERMFVALFKNDHMELTVNGMHFASTDVPFKEWEAAGRMLYMFERCRAFAVGDWLNYGEEAYGDKYTQAIDLNMYSYGTLRNLAWVANQIPSSRRRIELSYRHHAEVAGLKVKKQDELLDLAIKNQLTCDALREKVRSLEGKKKQTQLQLDTVREKANHLLALNAQWMSWWGTYSDDLKETEADSLMPHVQKIWEAAVKATLQS